MLGSARSLSSSGRAQVRKEINHQARVLDPNLTVADRTKVRANLFDLVEKVSDIMDLADAIHFVSQWTEGNESDFLELRYHIRDCPACSRAYAIVTQGSEVAFIPIGGDSVRDQGEPHETFSDEITVLPEAEGVNPKRELRLPHVPSSMKAAVSGRQLVVRARVNKWGKASVVRIEGAGLSEFVISRAREMVETTPWEPARSPMGTPVDGYVRVIFRWK